jgi:hypothetical protein
MTNIRTHRDKLRSNAIFFLLTQIMHPSMASNRLRTTFHYPSSSDSNDSADELDEEHQERLIASFQAEDARKNDLYRNAFLSVPSFGVLFFIYTCLAAGSLREFMIAVLSISSLASSAYIMKLMPIKSPARKGKIPMYQVEADKGPVERYMILLNGVLASLLFIVAVVSWSRGFSEYAYLEAFPAGKCWQASNREPQFHNY